MPLRDVGFIASVCIDVIGAPGFSIDVSRAKDTGVNTGVDWP